jgi:hypothetical protein
MASFKTNPIFCSALLLLGVIAVAEIYLIIPIAKLPLNFYAAKTGAAAKFKKSQNELQTLRATEVAAPTLANKQAIEDDLKRATAALAEMKAQLKGKGELADKLRAAPVPAESTDAYFSNTAFVEATRKKMREAGIKTKDDERFSFSAYISTGPEKELIAAVFHQQQVVEYLLNALMDARAAAQAEPLAGTQPVELVSVQRERPLTKAERDAAQAAADTGNTPPPFSTTTDGDIIDLDPLITARKAGFVDATAFRLTFIGQTQVLRHFLSKIGTFELPLVVRSVEVVSAGPVPTASSDDPAKLAAESLTSETTADSKNTPKVDRLQSKFIIYIEYIDLVPEKSENATPTTH